MGDSPEPAAAAAFRAGVAPAATPQRERLGWLLVVTAAVPVALTAVMVDEALGGEPWGADSALSAGAELMFRVLNASVVTVLPWALPPLGVLLWRVHARQGRRAAVDRAQVWLLRAAAAVAGLVTGIAVGLVAVVGYFLLPGVVTFPPGYFDPSPTPLVLLAPSLAAGVVVAVLAGATTRAAILLTRSPEPGEPVGTDGEHDPGLPHDHAADQPSNTERTSGPPRPAARPPDETADTDSDPYAMFRRPH